MKQNVKRINENQLRAIVSESVKNVLNEIDWKTYANAAEKNRDKEDEYHDEAERLSNMAIAAEERGDTKEAERLWRRYDAFINKAFRTFSFRTAATSAFGDKYFSGIAKKFDKNPESRPYPMMDMDDGSYVTPEPDYMGGGYYPGHGKIDGRYYDNNIAHAGPSNGEDMRYIGYEDGGSDYNTYTAQQLKDMGYDADDINDIEAARREIRRYRNGGYKYDNGWKLKK